MFTGLIEEVGRVVRVEGRTGEDGCATQASAGEDARVTRLVVSASQLTQELKKGASISVSGVCLTAVEVAPDSFAADDLIRQARRYSSRRDLTRALRLIARADLAVRSNPPSKRLVLEQLVMELAAPPKAAPPAWQQEELPV